MKPSLCLVGVALMLCVAVEPSSAQDLAFVGVSVVPMDRNGILNNRTVMVRDGRIADVGPAGKTKVPAGALRLESRGKYLMPGLGEMRRSGEHGVRLSYCVIVHSKELVGHRLGRPEQAQSGHLGAK